MLKHDLDPQERHRNNLILRSLLGITTDVRRAIERRCTQCGTVNRLAAGHETAKANRQALLHKQNVMIGLCNQLGIAVSQVDALIKALKDTAQGMEESVSNTFQTANSFAIKDKTDIDPCNWSL
ncbi:hypothetical protein WJX77_000955 [Trebouxia sp. C0004]